MLSLNRSIDLFCNKLIIILRCLSDLEKINVLQNRSKKGSASLMKINLHSISFGKSVVCKAGSKQSYHNKIELGKKGATGTGIR